MPQGHSYPTPHQLSPLPSPRPQPPLHTAMEPKVPTTTDSGRWKWVGFPMRQEADGFQGAYMQLQLSLLKF